MAIKAYFNPEVPPFFITWEAEFYGRPVEISEETRDKLVRIRTAQDAIAEFVDGEVSFDSDAQKLATFISEQVETI